MNKTIYETLPYVYIVIGFVGLTVAEFGYAKFFGVVLFALSGLILRARMKHRGMA